MLRHQLTHKHSLMIKVIILNSKFLIHIHFRKKPEFAYRNYLFCDSFWAFH
jgi:hypothetical protein